MNNAQGVAIRMEIKQQIENIQTAIRIMGQEIETMFIRKHTKNL